MNLPWQITNGNGGYDTATVTVAVVAPSNQPPVAVDDDVTTAPGTPVTINVTSSDYDLDGDEITVLGIVKGPIGGTLEITPGELRSRE